MRETAGLPAGILVYVVSMIFLLVLSQKLFVAPQEWATFITFATSLISFQVACWSAEKFSTLTGVKIVALLIALFQIIVLSTDFTEIFSETIGLLDGNDKTPADVFIEFIAAVWDSKICAGVTCLLALWTVSK